MKAVAALSIAVASLASPPRREQAEALWRDLGIGALAGEVRDRLERVMRALG